jgi:hypothetical protein
MENSATLCTVCGQAEGKAYEYLMVRHTVTKTKTRRKQAAKVTHNYSVMERNTACICDPCREKYRKSAALRHGRTFLISAVLFVGMLLALNWIGQDGNGLLFFLALVGAAFTLVFAIAGLVALLRCLGGDYGSQALGTHRKESRYAGSTDVVWMTPKEARNKGLIS